VIDLEFFEKKRVRTITLLVCVGKMVGWSHADGLSQQEWSEATVKSKLARPVARDEFRPMS